MELQVTELAIATNWLIARTPDVGINNAMDSVLREATTLLLFEPCMRLETIRLATATNTPVKIAQRTLAIVAMIRSDDSGYRVRLAYSDVHSDSSSENATEQSKLDQHDPDDGDLHSRH